MSIRIGNETVPIEIVRTGQLGTEFERNLRVIANQSLRKGDTLVVDSTGNSLILGPPTQKVESISIPAVRNLIPNPQNMPPLQAPLPTDPFWEAMEWVIEQIELFVTYLKSTLTDLVLSEDIEARILREYRYEEAFYLDTNRQPPKDPTLDVLDGWAGYYAEIVQTILPDGIDRGEVERAAIRFKEAAQLAHELAPIHRLPPNERPDALQTIQNRLAQQLRDMPPGHSMLIPVSWVASTGPVLMLVEIKKGMSEGEHELSFFSTSRALSGFFPPLDRTDLNEVSSTVRSFKGVAEGMLEPTLRTLLRIQQEPTSFKNPIQPLIRQLGFKSVDELLEIDPLTIFTRIKETGDRFNFMKREEAEKVGQEILSDLMDVGPELLPLLAGLGFQFAGSAARAEVLELDLREQELTLAAPLYALLMKAIQPKERAQRIGDLFATLGQFSMTEVLQQPAPSSDDLQKVVLAYHQARDERSAKLHEIIYSARRFMKEYERTRVLNLGSQWATLVIARARELYALAEAGRELAFSETAQQELIDLGDALYHVIEEARTQLQAGPSLESVLRNPQGQFQGTLGLPMFHTLPAHVRQAPPPVALPVIPDLNADSLTLEQLDQLLAACDQMCTRGEHDKLRRYCMAAVTALPTDRAKWMNIGNPDEWGKRMDRLGNYLSVAVLDRIAETAAGDVSLWVPYDDEIRTLMRVWCILDQLARNQSSEFYNLYTSRFDDGFVHWYLQYNSYFNTGDGLSDAQLMEDLEYLHQAGDQKETYQMTGRGEQRYGFPPHEQRIIDAMECGPKERKLPPGMERIWQHRLRLRLIFQPLGFIFPEFSVSGMAQSPGALLSAGYRSAIKLDGSEALVVAMERLISRCRKMQPQQWTWHYPESHVDEKFNNPLSRKADKIHVKWDVEQWDLRLSGLGWSIYEGSNEFNDFAAAHQRRVSLARGASCTGRPMSDPLFRERVAQVPPSRGETQDPERKKIAQVLSGNDTTFNLPRYDILQMQLERVGRVVEGEGELPKWSHSHLLYQVPVHVPQVVGGVTTVNVSVLPRAIERSDGFSAQARLTDSTVILVALSDLGNRVDLLENLQVQREIEQTLFRPGALEMAALGNPAFCEEFARVITAGLKQAEHRQDLATCLFLANLAHRSYQRLIKWSDQAPHVHTLCQTLPNYDRMIANFLNRDREDWIALRRDLLHEHRLKYYMSLGTTPSSEQEITEVLASYAMYNFAAVGAIDRDPGMEDRLRLWMERNLRIWSTDFSTDAQRLRDRLNPVLAALRPDLAADQLEHAIWQMDGGFPNFTTQLAGQTIQLRLAEGQVFVNGRGRGLIPMAVLSDEYQKLFGRRRFSAEFSCQGEGVTFKRCYRFDCEGSRYEVQLLSDDNVLILREDVRPDGKVAYFQYTRPPIEANADDPIPEGIEKLPAEFLAHHLWSCCDLSGAILLTDSRGATAGLGWTHSHGISALYDSQGQRILAPGHSEQLPQVLAAIEHPSHIRIVGDKVEFSRLGLTFTQTQNPQDRLLIESTRFPGYGIPKHNANPYDPFGDGNFPGLVLEKRGDPNDRVVVMHGGVFALDPQTRATTIKHHPLSGSDHRDRLFTYEIQTDGSLYSKDPDSNLWLTYLFMVKGDYQKAEFYLDKAFSGCAPSKFYTDCCRWIGTYKHSAVDCRALQLRLIAVLSTRPHLGLIQDKTICGLTHQEFINLYRAYVAQNRDRKLPRLLMLSAEDSHALLRLVTQSLRGLGEEALKKGLRLIKTHGTDPGILTMLHKFESEAIEEVSRGSGTLATEICRKMHLNSEPATAADLPRLFSQQHPDWVAEFPLVYERLRQLDGQNAEAHQELLGWLTALNVNRAEDGWSELARAALLIVVCKQLDPEDETTLLPLGNLFESLSHDPRPINNTFTFGLDREHRVAVDQLTVVLDNIFGNQRQISQLQKLRQAYGKSRVLFDYQDLAKLILRLVGKMDLPQIIDRADRSRPLEEDEDLLRECAEILGQVVDEREIENPLAFSELLANKILLLIEKRVLSLSPERREHLSKTLAIPLNYLVLDERNRKRAHQAIIYSEFLKLLDEDSSQPLDPQRAQQLTQVVTSDFARRFGTDLPQDSAATRARFETYLKESFDQAVRAPNSTVRKLIAENTAHEILGMLKNTAWDPERLPQTAAPVVAPGFFGWMKTTVTSILPQSTPEENLRATIVTEMLRLANEAAPEAGMFSFVTDLLPGEQAAQQQPTSRLASLRKMRSGVKTFLKVQDWVDVTGPLTGLIFTYLRNFGVLQEETLSKKLEGHIKAFIQTMLNPKSTCSPEKLVRDFLDNLKEDEISIPNREKHEEALTRVLHEIRTEVGGRPAFYTAAAVLREIDSLDLGPEQLYAVLEMLGTQEGAVKKANDTLQQVKLPSDHDRGNVVQKQQNLTQALNGAGTAVSGFATAYGAAQKTTEYQRLQAQLAYRSMTIPDSPAPLPVRSRKLFTELNSRVNPILQRITVTPDSNSQRAWTAKWQRQKEGIFSSKKFSKTHHQKRAAQLAQAYEKVCSQREFNRYSIDNTQMMIQELKSLKSSLQEDQNRKVRELDQLQLLYTPRKGLPGAIPRVLSPPPVLPVDRLLSLWEQDRLGEVRSLYQWQISDEQLGELSTIIERIQLFRVWINQVTAALQVVEEIQKTAPEMEELRSVLTKDLRDLLDADHYYIPGHPDLRLRKILAIEREEKFIVRKKQLEVTNMMIEHPQQAVQAAVGSGKSSVINKLVQSLWGDGRHLCVLVVTLDEYAETLKREDLSTRPQMGRPVVPFEFTEKSPTTAEDLITLHIQWLRCTLEGGKVITTPLSLLVFRDRYIEKWLQLQSYSPIAHDEIQKLQVELQQASKSDQIKKLQGKIDQIQDKLNALHSEVDIWSKLFVMLNGRAPLLCDEMEELLDISKMVNLGLKVLSYIDPSRRVLAQELLMQILKNPELLAKMKLLENEQRLLSLAEAHTIATELAGEFADQWNFKQEHRALLVKYLTGTGSKAEVEPFRTDVLCSHPDFKKFVVLRQLFQAFPVIRQMHGVEVGRMPDDDDVGPYQGIGKPQEGCHIADPSEWAISVYTNYVLRGVTEEQLDRMLAEFKKIAYQAFLDDDPEPEIISQFRETYGVDPLTMSPQEREQVLQLINEGISEEQLDQFLHQIAQEAAQAKSQGLPSPEIVQNFQKAYGVNPLDLSEEDRKNVLALCRHQKKLEFASDFVLARKPFFAKQIRGNAQHLAYLGASCGGYSGTMATSQTFANNVLKNEKTYDPFFDGYLLMYVIEDLLRDGGCEYVSGRVIEGTPTSGKEIGDIFASCQGTIAITDDGPGLKNYNVDQTVDWLTDRENMATVGDYNHILYWDQKGRKRVRDVGSAPGTDYDPNRPGRDSKKTFRLYMQPDCRGKDDRLPPGATQTYIVGEASRFTSAEQAWGRCRQFGERGQHVRARIMPQVAERLNDSSDDPLAYQVIRYLIRQEADVVATMHFRSEPQKLRSYIENSLFQAMLLLPAEDRVPADKLIDTVFVAKTADDLSTREAIDEASQILDLAKPALCIQRERLNQLQQVLYLDRLVKNSTISEAGKRMLSQALGANVATLALEIEQAARQAAEKSRSSTPHAWATTLFEKLGADPKKLENDSAFQNALNQAPPRLATHIRLFLATIPNLPDECDPCYLHGTKELLGLTQGGLPKIAIDRCLDGEQHQKLHQFKQDVRTFASPRPSAAQLILRHQMIDPGLMTDDLQQLPTIDSQSSSQVMQNQNQNQNQNQTEIDRQTAGEPFVNRPDEIRWDPYKGWMTSIGALHEAIKNTNFDDDDDDDYGYRSSRAVKFVSLSALNPCFHFARLSPNQGFRLEEAIKKGESTQGRYSLAWNPDIEPCRLAYLSYDPHEDKWVTTSLTNSDYHDEVYPLLRQTTSPHSHRAYVLLIEGGEVRVIDRSSNVTSTQQAVDFTQESVGRIQAEWQLAAAQINPRRSFRQPLEQLVTRKPKESQEVMAFIINQQRTELLNVYKDSQFAQFVENGKK